jgi:NAD(P)H dehydrogenase (quinone)
MKISVILAHPYKKSFNYAIAETVLKKLKDNNHTILFHDLYEENFDPVLDAEELSTDYTDDTLVVSHCEEISSAEAIIIIHPNWWGQPPAILKGWIDRVFRHKIAYLFDENDSGGGIPTGLLKASQAMVFTTSNTNAEREMKNFGDPLETLWRNCIFGFCGVHKFYRRNFNVIAESSLVQRIEWLEEVKDIINDYFPKFTIV